MSATKQKNGEPSEDVLENVFEDSEVLQDVPEVMRQPRAQHDVYLTDNYDLFTLHKTNRDVNSSYVKNLKAAMKKVGFLRSEHILVDVNGVVLDGQHRLQAAKELGISVPYSVYEGEYSQELVVLLNMAQEKWSMEDFVQSYADQEIEDYQEYLAFADEYEFPIGVPGHIVGCNTNKVKRGDLEWPEDDEWMHKVGNVCATIRDATGERYPQSRPFISAVKKILSSYDVIEPMEFARKAAEAINQDRMHKSRKVGDYKYDLIEAWNFNRNRSGRKYISNITL